MSLKTEESRAHNVELHTTLLHYCSNALHVLLLGSVERAFAWTLTEYGDICGHTVADSIHAT